MEPAVFRKMPLFSHSAAFVQAWQSQVAPSKWGRSKSSLRRDARSHGPTPVGHSSK